MSPLLYWILFTVLVALLVIFVSCLIFNVIVDNCLVDPDDIDKYDEETEENCRLRRHYFDKHDVEDLTRMQGDLKTALPNLSLTNEVEKNTVDRLLKQKERISSLSNIAEEGSKHSLDDLQSTSSFSTTLTDHEIPKTSKNKTAISQSVDNLEFCDPSSIDALKLIHKIEDEAKRIDKDLDYFVGSTKDVKYYEINEALLRLMISLCDIYCETSELRKKKSDILEYIEECQKKLKMKVNDML